MHGLLTNNKHKFVQKDAKVEVLNIIISLIKQRCAELGEQRRSSKVAQAEFLLCIWLQRCPSFSTYRNNLAKCFQVYNLPSG